MPFWPFRRKWAEATTPEEVRDRLIAAAGRRRRLRAACERYKGLVGAHLDTMRQVPPTLRNSPEALDKYVQRLMAVAKCLASECQSPELLEALTGGSGDNPFEQFQRWYEGLPGRMEGLEFNELISEARTHLGSAQRLQGHHARRSEAILHGRLGELLFHSGRVSEAFAPLREALAICREIGDVEGVAAYLEGLLQAHRYCGDPVEAAACGDELIGLHERKGIDAESLRKRVEQIRRVEPLCRIVGVRDGSEVELEEFSGPLEGRIEFRFRRNRPSLRKAEVLVRRGNTLASTGQLAEALEAYRQAAEVDPHDPDPIYQEGVCLLELGSYAPAREAFKDVERLAPGWFRCRADWWLAGALVAGEVDDEVFRLLRLLEDGDLEPGMALKLAEEAVEKHPEFAPFWLLLGNLRRNQGDSPGSIESYRMGLRLAAEPDLESRLSCALAGLLPAGSSERGSLIERAAQTEGSLVAQATARLMAIAG